MRRQISTYVTNMLGTCCNKVSTNPIISIEPDEAHEEAGAVDNFGVIHS